MTNDIPTPRTDAVAFHIRHEHVGNRVVMAKKMAELERENVVLRQALEWYAAPHRPEDYINDNGDVAIKALTPPTTI